MSKYVVYGRMIKRGSVQLHAILNDGHAIMCEPQGSQEAVGELVDSYEYAKEMHQGLELVAEMLGGEFDFVLIPPELHEQFVKPPGYQKAH